MLRNSIKSQTILGVAVIEGVFLFALVMMMLGFIRDTNFSEMDKRAQSTASLFATTVKDAVLSYDLASLDAFVTEVMKNEDLLYARVINDKGLVLAQSSNAQPSKVDLLATQVDDGVLDIRTPIIEGGKTYGWIEVGFSIEPILQVIHRAERWSFSIVGLEMLLVALFSLALGQFLTRKLSILRAAAEQISQGKQSIHIDVKGHDEVDVVAHAFNHMSQTLDTARQQEKTLETKLRQLNESLEIKVQERTQGLREKNAQLEVANAKIKTAQRKLIDAEKRATAGILAAGIAHEVNNPLSIVRSNVDTLKHYITHCLSLLQQLKSNTEPPTGPSKDINDDELIFIKEDYKQLIEDTEIGIKRATEIIAELGSFELGLSNLSLNRTANIFLSFNLALDKLPSERFEHVHLMANLEEIPATRGNQDILTELLLLVLENAFFAAHNVSKGLVRVDYESTEDHVLLFIRDNGPGIAKEIESQVFDPFFTTHEVGDGTGLGLFKARALAEAIGAELVLEQAEQGATFKITLQRHH